MASRPKRKHQKRGTMPGIKHLKIPEPVAIVNTMDDGGERPPVLVEGKPLVISLRRLVLLALEHESFRKSRQAFRSGEKLAELVEAARPGQVVPVADDDLQRLLTASEDVTVFGWVNWILRQCRPLFAALEGAKDRAEDHAPPAGATTHANGAVQPAPPPPAAEVAQA